LHLVDKRRGFRRSAVHNILEAGGELERFNHPDWSIRPAQSDRLHALVLEVDSERARLKLGGYQAELLAKDARWARKKLSERLQRGDVILVQVLNLDPAQQTMQVALDQEPEIEGALLTLDA